MDLLKPRKKVRKSVTEELKESVMEKYAMREREAKFRHRRYLKVLSAETSTRNEDKIESTFRNSHGQLRKEKELLKSKIFVANGRQHASRYERLLPYIHCHIKCQERLSDQIQYLRSCVENMTRAISRVSKQVYDLNRKTVPETQHQLHVAKRRKQSQMMENRLEIGMSRECDFTAQNATLRKDLIRALKERADFNSFYTKMVHKLNNEKRYLTDLIEFAMSKFEACIEEYEKMETMQKRDLRVADGYKMDMEAQIRNFESAMEAYEFIEMRKPRRSMTGVKMEKTRHRASVMQRQEAKINYYNAILDKILTYTKSKNVKSVIEKFQAQESRYYSYYNYTNEVGYHMTLLNNSVNRLFTDIEGLKENNRNGIQLQLKTITELEDKLELKKANNEKLRRRSDNNDTRLETLLTGIQLIKDSCQVPSTSPQLLLGKFDRVDLLNMGHYLKIIQQRVIEIVSATYIMERMDDDKTYSDYVIKDITKFGDWTTELDEIVLAQQCPECAESDVANLKDGRPVKVLSKEAVRRSLYDKIQQPEMQYRLHSLSQCRLPRSRLIAAKQLNTRFV